MQAPSPLTDIVHFGIFKLDLKARELHKAGVKVKLQLGRAPLVAMGHFDRPIAARRVRPQGVEAV